MTMNWICTIALLFGASAYGQAANLRTLQEGAYLVRMAGCVDCHTVDWDRPFAGGYALWTPFGTFYTPNITPDKETGIGNWTEQDLRRALRSGVSPEGRVYYPSFPYRSYTKITDEDIHKMWAYLETVPAIQKSDRVHNLEFPFNQRWLMYFWQELFFRGPKSNPLLNIKVGTGPFVPDPERSPQWNRGAYLVESLFHCTECHTPRNRFGAPIADQWMSGSDLGHGEIAPNITTDPGTGLGAWTPQDWNTFLSSGFTPQRNSVGGEMAEVIQNTAALTKSDRTAVIKYLRSLPPVRSKYRASSIFDKKH